MRRDGYVKVIPKVVRVTYISGRLQELFISNLKSLFNWGFSNVIITRADRFESGHNESFDSTHKRHHICLVQWYPNIHSYSVLFKTEKLIFFFTGIKKGYIFPRVAKNNRFVHPKSARGVISYRKNFCEV